jgi:D-beta-D-heptose 7-phosphate kinase/D-beta-D-heptose 1-phosphate adenosyltransferase
MLDEYLFGQTNRVSSDAPVPVVSLDRRELRPGGAANVAANLKALGAEPALVGVIGEDLPGQVLRKEIASLGMEYCLITEPGRRTTHKTRIVARQQQMVRFDEESTTPLAASTAATLLRTVTSLRPPAVVLLSDHAKGVLTATVAAEVLRWATSHRVPVIVDPAGSDMAMYRGATYLTPNVTEAVGVFRLPLPNLAQCVAAGRKLMGETLAHGVLIKRGERGMVLVTPSVEYPVPANRRSVFDVTGAGDTVLATFGLGLAAKAEPQEAAILANVAAGVVVGKLGSASCSRHELSTELDTMGIALARPPSVRILPAPPLDSMEEAPSGRAP